VIFLAGFKRPDTVKNVDGGITHKPCIGLIVAFFPCNNEFRNENIKRLNKAKVSLTIRSLTFGLATVNMAMDIRFPFS
jgi:hypothetical protein